MPATLGPLQELAFPSPTISDPSMPSRVAPSPAVLTPHASVVKRLRLLPIDPKTMQLSEPHSPTSVVAINLQRSKKSQDGYPTLVQMVDTIWSELHGAGAPALSLRDTLQVACSELGVEAVGGYLQQARSCYAQLLPSANDSPSSSARAYTDNVPDLRIDGFSAAVRAPDDVISGPSLTERSDRTNSERESPPRLSSRLPGPTAAREPIQNETVQLIFLT